MESSFNAILLIVGTVVLVVTDACTNERFAVCAVKKNPGSAENVSGVVRFKQCENEPITISVELSGFDPADVETDDSLHGFHVHAFGDITGGCDSTGGHFNPHGVNHGGPDAETRHSGDFGNLRQTAEGRMSITFTDRLATLYGENTIIGRAIVVHAGVDDLGLGGNPGSLANGNAGPRLGCCVIGASKPW